MSEDGERLAVLETKIGALELRVKELEGNHKLGIIAVLAAVLSAVLNMVIKK